MTKNEVVVLFQLICVLFPANKAFASANEMMRDVWYEFFKQDSSEVVGAALKKHAVTNRFAPSVSELRESISEMTHPKAFIDPDEAWGMVMHAMKRHGFYNQTEALNSLPPIVASTVRTFGWKDLCLSQNLAVDRGQFRKSYEMRLNREKEKAQMPLEIQKQINAISDKISMNLLKEIPGKTNPTEG